jgi:hypothetical protein
MPTPTTRATVSLLSLAAALGATVLLGACASAPPVVAWDGSTVTSERPLTLRFENEAQTYVDVYLVNDRQQWRLGRIAPGARTTLRVPEEALDVTYGFVRLAVLAGAPLSADAARDPRATFTIVQSTSQLLAQRWTFWQTPLASAEILSAPADARRP